MTELPDRRLLFIIIRAVWIGGMGDGDQVSVLENAGSVISIERVFIRLQRIKEFFSA